MTSEAHSRRSWSKIQWTHLRQILMHWHMYSLVWRRRKTGMTRIRTRQRIFELSFRFEQWYWIFTRGKRRRLQVARMSNRISHWTLQQILQSWRQPIVLYLYKRAQHHRALSRLKDRCQVKHLQACLCSWSLCTHIEGRARKMAWKLHRRRVCIIYVDILFELHSYALRKRRMRTRMMRSARVIRYIKLESNFILWHSKSVHAKRLQVRLVQFDARIQFQRQRYQQSILIQLMSCWSAHSKKMAKMRYYSAYYSANSSDDSEDSSRDFSIQSSHKNRSFPTPVKASRSRQLWPKTSRALHLSETCHTADSLRAGEIRNSVAYPPFANDSQSDDTKIEEKCIESNSPNIVGLLSGGVVIPAHALVENVIVSVQITKNPPGIRHDKLQSMKFKSEVLTFAPSGLVFRRPVTLWLRFAGTAAAGNRLAIHKFNPETRDWDEQLSQCLQEEILSVNILSFSTYAVLEVPAESDSLNITSPERRDSLTLNSISSDSLPPSLSSSASDSCSERDQLDEPFAVECHQMEAAVDARLQTVEVPLQDMKSVEIPQTPRSLISSTASRANDETVAETPRSCVSRDNQGNPSWKGRFQNPITKQWLEMSLPIVSREDQELAGKGSDKAGIFTLSARVQGDTVTFVKTYEGSHSVIYEGTLRSGKVTGTFTLAKDQGGACGLFELEVGLGSVLESMRGVDAPSSTVHDLQNLASPAPVASDEYARASYSFASPQTPARTPSNNSIASLLIDVVNDSSRIVSSAQSITSSLLSPARVPRKSSKKPSIPPILRACTSQEVPNSSMLSPIPARSQEEVQVSSTNVDDVPSSNIISPIPARAQEEVQVSSTNEDQQESHNSSQKTAKNLNPLDHEDFVGEGDQPRALHVVKTSRRSAWDALPAERRSRSARAAPNVITAKFTAWHEWSVAIREERHRIAIQIRRHRHALSIHVLCVWWQFSASKRRIVFIASKLQHSKYTRICRRVVACFCHFLKRARYSLWLSKIEAHCNGRNARACALRTLVAWRSIASLNMLEFERSTFNLLADNREAELDKRTSRTQEHQTLATLRMCKFFQSNRRSRLAFLAWKFQVSQIGRISSHVVTRQQSLFKLTLGKFHALWWWRTWERKYSRRILLTRQQSLCMLMLGKFHALWLWWIWERKHSRRTLLRMKSVKRHRMLSLVIKRLRRHLILQQIVASCRTRNARRNLQYTFVKLNDHTVARRKHKSHYTVCLARKFLHDVFVKRCALNAWTEERMKRRKWSQQLGRFAHKRFRAHERVYFKIWAEKVFLDMIRHRVMGKICRKRFDTCMFTCFQHMRDYAARNVTVGKMNSRRAKKIVSFVLCAWMDWLSCESSQRAQSAHLMCLNDGSARNAAIARNLADVQRKATLCRRKLRAWFIGASRNIVLRACSQRCQREHARRALSRCFELWICTCSEGVTIREETAHLARLDERLSLRKLRSLTRFTFSKWVALASVSSKKDSALIRICSRVQMVRTQHIILEAFYIWSDMTAEQMRFKHIILKMRKRQHGLLQAIAFWSWWGKSSTAKRFLRAKMKVVNKRSKAAFMHWVAVADSRNELGVRMHRLCAQWKRRRLTLVFARLTNRFWLNKIIKGRLRFCKQRRQVRTFVLTFDYWRAYVRTVQVGRKADVRCTMLIERTHARLRLLAFVEMSEWAYICRLRKSAFEKVRFKVSFRVKHQSITSAMAAWIDVHERRMRLRRSSGKVKTILQEKNSVFKQEILSAWADRKRHCSRLERLQSFISKFCQRQSRRMACFCVNHLRLQVCVRKASQRFFYMLLRRRKSKYFSKWEIWSTETKRIARCQQKFSYRSLAHVIARLLSSVFRAWHDHQNWIKQTENQLAQQLMYKAGRTLLCSFQGLRLEADFQFLSQQCRSALEAYVSKSWSFQSKQIHFAQWNVSCSSDRRLLCFFSRTHKLSIQRNIVRSWFAHMQRKKTRTMRCAQMLVAHNRTCLLEAFLRLRSSKAMLQGRRGQMGKDDFESVMFSLSQQLPRVFRVAQRMALLRGVGMFMSSWRARHPELCCAFTQKQRVFYSWEEFVAEAKNETQYLRRWKHMIECFVRKFAYELQTRSLKEYMALWKNTCQLQRELRKWAATAQRHWQTGWILLVLDSWKQVTASRKQDSLQLNRVNQVCSLSLLLSCAKRLRVMRLNVLVSGTRSCRPTRGEKQEIYSAGGECYPLRSSTVLESLDTGVQEH